MKRARLLVPAALLVCGAVLFFLLNRPAPLTLRDGLFSWGEEALAPGQRDGLLETLARLEAGTLYQEFPAGDPEAAPFLADMKRAGIQVFLLTGRPEWGLEPDGASLKAEVDRAAALSSQTGGALSGLMVDVEPYLTDAWDENEARVLEQYTAAMAAARDYAAERGLALLACIPYWYDNDHPEALARLIETGCDGVAVMNYYREKEAEHIQTEAALARRAGKPVVCIFEFQSPGTHGLTDQNTYYHSGLAAAHEAWNTVRRKVDYDRMTLAYHCYTPVRELLEQAE